MRGPPVGGFLAHVLSYDFRAKNGQKRPGHLTLLHSASLDALQLLHPLPLREDTGHTWTALTPPHVEVTCKQPWLCPRPSLCFAVDQTRSQGLAVTLPATALDRTPREVAGWRAGMSWRWAEYSFCQFEGSIQALLSSWL